MNRETMHVSTVGTTGTCTTVVFEMLIIILKKLGSIVFIQFLSIIFKRFFYISLYS